MGESLANFVRKRYNKKEILIVSRKEYPNYAWSIRTLGNRLSHFAICYVDNALCIENVYTAIQSELDDQVPSWDIEQCIRRYVRSTN